MNRTPYPTDLTDVQWAILEPMLPPHRPRGYRRQVELREDANALLYLLRTGCPWRQLRHDLPPPMTVWWYFRKWLDDGTLDALQGKLRDVARNEKEPSAGVIDLQAAKIVDKRRREAAALARRFKDASDRLSSIPLESFWGWLSG